MCLGAPAQNASDLATRTEKMLAQVEGFSAETDRQVWPSSARQATWRLEPRRCWRRLRASLLKPIGRLAQLSTASALATRTEKMLAQVEGFSAETDRRLAQLSRCKRPGDSNREDAGAG